MSTLDSLPANQSSPEVAEALAGLRAGKRLVTLAIDDVDRRVRALEAVLDELADLDARDGDLKIVWIGNPLRSPLTIERVFLQAVGAEADLRVERSPAELAQLLTRSAGDAKRLLLILQQPETLDAEARDRLAALAGFLPDHGPTVQILFSGTRSFQELPCRRSLALAVRPLVFDREPAPPSRGRLEALPLLLLLALAGAGAMVTPALLRRPPPPTQAAPASAVPASAAPAASGTDFTAPITSGTTALKELSTPADAASPSAQTVDVAALRREFDEFLAHRAPVLRTLSESQKEALFQEFLQRHRERSAAQPM